MSRGGIKFAKKMSLKDNINMIKKLWKYMKEFKWQLFVVVVLILFYSGSSILGPIYIGKIIDTAISQHNMRLLLSYITQLTVIYLFGSLCMWLQSFIITKISHGTIQNLRNDLYQKLNSLSIRFFDTHKHGDIMSRITNDIDQINNAMTSCFTQIISGVITLVGITISMITINIPMSLIIFITLPISIFVLKGIMQKGQQYFVQQQKTLGQLNSLIHESTLAQETVKAFTNEEKMITDFDTINQNYKIIGEKAQMYSGITFSIMAIINNLNYIAIAIVGAILVYYNWLTVGLIGTFITFSRQFGQPLNQLTSQLNQVQIAVAGSQRVFEILETQEEVIDIPEAKDLTEEIEVIEFDHVSFGYEPDKIVLKDISFIAHKGEKVALVGPTGVGKTTIINLIMRFYDIQEGEIKINGQNIKHFTLHSLRKKIGMVLQDTVLFHGTIEENIRFGSLDATMEEITFAAKESNADQFIEQLQDGYQTILSSSGDNISAGQRQLLSIARTIIADPDVLILDEATSNIDTRTEKKIQEAMEYLMKGRINIVIAHRLSTIRESDMILVMKNGSIVERGKHQELLDKKGAYLDIYNSIDKKD